MARLADEEGMHLDVASGGELHVALSAGVPPERLILHGNNKSADELADGARSRASAASSSTPSTRSPAWAPAGVRRRPDGERPKVLVRVTPGVEAHTHEFVRTGQEDSKFGFSVSSGAAAAGGGRPGAHARRRAGRRARAHREPGLRGVLLRAGGRGARRVLRPARPARARRRRRARRALRQRRVGPDAGRLGRRRPAAPARGRAWTRPRGSRPSPGVPSWPRPA